MPSLVKTEGNFCMQKFKSSNINFRWAWTQFEIVSSLEAIFNVTQNYDRYDYRWVPHNFSSRFTSLTSPSDAWQKDCNFGKMTFLINRFHMYCKLPLICTVDFPAVVWKSPTLGALLTLHGVEDTRLNSERDGVWRKIAGPYMDFPLCVKWLTRSECR